MEQENAESTGWTPIRKFTTIMTDDGRRIDMIEVIGHTPKSTIVQDPGNKIPARDVVFLGHVTIYGTPYSFYMSVDTIEEAYEKYEVVVKEMVRAVEENQTKAKQKVDDPNNPPVVDIEKPVDPSAVI